jgi:acetyl-CoA synthetase
VPDLPKTRTMKIMRRVVKALVLGDPPGDLSSLSNPESIDQLKQAASQGCGVKPACGGKG